MRPDVRDLDRIERLTPMIDVYDFRGPRIDVMNEGLIAVVAGNGDIDDNALYRDKNILNKGPIMPCLLTNRSTDPVVRGLKSRILACFRHYMITHHPEQANDTYQHRSWCNHYGPSVGAPWHDHTQMGASFSAVYAITPGIDCHFLFIEKRRATTARMVDMPAGRLLIMPSNLVHCTTPNAGPETRITLPVDFTLIRHSILKP